MPGGADVCWRKRIMVFLEKVGGAREAIVVRVVTQGKEDRLCLSYRLACRPYVRVGPSDFISSRCTSPFEGSHANTFSREQHRTFSKLKIGAWSCFYHDFILVYVVIKHIKLYLIQYTDYLP